MPRKKNYDKKKYLQSVQDEHGLKYHSVNQYSLLPSQELQTIIDFSYTVKVSLSPDGKHPLNAILIWRRSQNRFFAFRLESIV